MTRPVTEWEFDDLDRMKFAAVSDFTGSVFDQRFVGMVLAFTEKREDGTLESGRFQFSMEPDLALAMAQALLEHVAELQG